MKKRHGGLGASICLRQRRLSDSAQTAIARDDHLSSVRVATLAMLVKPKNQSTVLRLQHHTDAGRHEALA